MSAMIELITKLTGSKPSTAELTRAYTPKEAAKFLGSSEKELEKGRRNGTGPKYVRLGSRTVRYPLIYLIEHQESKSAASTAEERVSGRLRKFSQAG